MGSTISTGRVVAALETQHGRKLFVLFEESYCSNVFPQTPHWCCVGLGYLPEAMTRIFGMASSCEGGMLRNRSGRLTPEGYIGTWLKELANPLILQRTDVRVQVGSGMYRAVPTAQLDEAVDLLARAGRADQANQANTLHDTNTVTLDLVRDADAVLTLQAGLSVSPWQLIERHAVSHRHGERSPQLGYAPRPSRTPKLEPPIALKLNQDVRLLQDEVGVWRCGGWQYALIGQHVRDLWRDELACPGHHRKRIATFRDALERAPQAPVGLVVEISGAGVEDGYYRQQIETLRQAAEGGDPFRVPVTSDNEYTLTNLPRASTQLLIPDRKRAITTDQAALAL